MSNQVWVIGHKNPDTDSIASAIAYSHLKNAVWRRDGVELYAKPGRLGPINSETEFVLDRFGFDPPDFVPDLWGRVGDIMQRSVPHVHPNTPLIDIGKFIREKELRAVPVVEEDMRLVGIVTVGDVAKKYFAEDHLRLSETPLKIKNLVTAVEGRLLTPTGDKVLQQILPGRVLIGAMSPESMATYFSQGDILLIGDRENAQEAAIEAGCACLIITGGFPVSQKVLAKAKERGVFIISSPLDTYMVARRITMSLPVSTTMNREVLTFKPTDLLDEVRERMVKYKHRNYPVVDENNRLVGLINRGSLLAGPAKKVILVDHNEESQSVEGLSQTEILEVIDHHRLGDVQTVNPIYFRNEPVGSTATLVAEAFREEKVLMSPEIAGLLLGAVLSDTLLFKSPTTTEKDKRVAERLAGISGITDIEAFGRELLEAGTDLESLTPAEMITEDLKQYTFGEGFQVGVAQVETVNLDRFLERSGQVLEEMEAYRKNNGLDLFLLMVTDLFKHGSELLVSGPAVHVVEKAFGYPVQNKRVFLPGVLSRKKQVVPPLGRAVQEVQL